MVVFYNISFKKPSLIMLEITMFSDDFPIVLHVIINIIKRIINYSASTLSIKIIQTENIYSY